MKHVFVKLATFGSLETVGFRQDKLPFRLIKSHVRKGMGLAVIYFVMDIKQKLKLNSLTKIYILNLYISIYIHRHR